MGNESYEEEKSLSRSMLSLVVDEVCVWGLNRRVHYVPLVDSANTTDDADYMGFEMRLAFEVGDSCSELYSVLSESNCDN